MFDILLASWIVFFLCNDDSCRFISVVKCCTQTCGRGRDRCVVVEQELAQFIRGLMQFVYPSSAIPAAYDVTALLKPVELQCAEVDPNLYR